MARRTPLERLPLARPGWVCIWLMAMMVAIVLVLGVIMLVTIRRWSTGRSSSSSSSFSAADWEADRARQRQVLRTAPSPPPLLDIPQGSLAVCVIVKDEDPYLLEWLDFHRRQGVDLFLLFDTGSADETVSLLEHERAAHPDVFVFRREYPSDAEAAKLARRLFQPPATGQVVLLEECVGWIREHAEHLVSWVAFFDVDEYMLPSAGLRARGIHRVRDFLAQPALNEEIHDDDGTPVFRVGAVVVPRVFFGSGGRSVRTTADIQAEGTVRAFVHRANVTHWLDPDGGACDVCPPGLPRLPGQSLLSQAPSGSGKSAALGTEGKTPKSGPLRRPFRRRNHAEQRFCANLFTGKTIARLEAIGNVRDAHFVTFPAPSSAPSPTLAEAMSELRRGGTVSAEDLQSALASTRDAPSLPSAAIAGDVVRNDAKASVRTSSSSSSSSAAAVGTATEEVVELPFAFVDSMGEMLGVDVEFLVRARCPCAAGQPLNVDPDRLIDGTCLGCAPQVCQDHGLRLHHYMVRSREEFVYKAMGSVWKDKYEPSIEAWFEAFDRNEVEDASAAQLWDDLGGGTVAEEPGRTPRKVDEATPLEAGNARRMERK